MDQSERRPEIASALRARLEAQIAREREGSSPAEPLDVDDETRLRLRSLGYGE